MPRTAPSSSESRTDMQSDLPYDRPLFVIFSAIPICHSRVTATQSVILSECCVAAESKFCGAEYPSRKQDTEQSKTASA